MGRKLRLAIGDLGISRTARARGAGRSSNSNRSSGRTRQKSTTTAARPGLGSRTAARQRQRQLSSSPMYGLVDSNDNNCSAARTGLVHSYTSHNSIRSAWAGI
eukprot:jgi/Undpi1/5243/HiC_scaffold_2.g00524.m1